MLPAGRIIQCGIGSPLLPCSVCMLRWEGPAPATAATAVISNDVNVPQIANPSTTNSSSSIAVNCTGAGSHCFTVSTSNSSSHGAAAGDGYPPLTKLRHSSSRNSSCAALRSSVVAASSGLLLGYLQGQTVEMLQR
jgi:hypothetical protein